MNMELWNQLPSAATLIFVALPYSPMTFDANSISSRVGVLILRAPRVDPLIQARLALKLTKEIVHLSLIEPRSAIVFRGVRSHQ
ncbi:MAG: hypothetical protein CM1200mP24_00010 [Gammaproteobacteria bacterium]|nr:MAG: hypothetical protein CM1200mP24_00010 [Gammaproteobacteria bacterium]